MSESKSDPASNMTDAQRRLLEVLRAIHLADLGISHDLEWAIADVVAEVARWCGFGTREARTARDLVAMLRREPLPTSSPTHSMAIGYTSIARTPAELAAQDKIAAEGAKLTAEARERGRAAIERELAPAPAPPEAQIVRLEGRIADLERRLAAMGAELDTLAEIRVAAPAQRKRLDELEAKVDKLLALFREGVL